MMLQELLEEANIGTLICLVAFVAIYVMRKRSLAARMAAQPRGDGHEAASGRK